MDEAVLEKVTEGGVSTVINHGQNRILSQNGWSLKPAYEYVANQFELLAKAEIGVKEEIASQMYPYMNWQSLMNYGADVQVKYRWSCFKLTAEIGYAAGNVVEESLITDEQTGVQTAPFRLQHRTLGPVFFYEWAKASDVLRRLFHLASRIISSRRKEGHGDGLCRHSFYVEYTRGLSAASDYRPHCRDSAA